MNEYINICNIKNICSDHADSPIFSKIIDKSASLKKMYEQILFRVGYIDLSFSILLKEIENRDNSLFDEKKVEDLLNYFKKSLYFYEIELDRKMKKLMLNEFEIHFIKNLG